MIYLTEQERSALSAFIGEHWSLFKQSAKDYLDEDALEKLAEKLEEST